MQFLRMQNKLLTHVDFALRCSVKVAVQIGKLEEVSKLDFYFKQWINKISLFTIIIIFFW